MNPKLRLWEKWRRNFWITTTVLLVIQHTKAELFEDIVEGDKIKVGRTEMKVLKVGDAVNKNLRAEGHCTIVVNGEASLPGQIAVKSDIPPRLRIGNEITVF